MHEVLAFNRHHGAHTSRIHMRIPLLQGVRHACHSVRARLDVGLGNAVTQRHLQLCQRIPLLPARRQSGGGVGGSRLFSDKPGNAALSQPAAQPTALQRVRQASAAGSGALKALTQTAGNTSSAAYKQLPDKVMQKLQPQTASTQIEWFLQHVWQHACPMVCSLCGGCQQRDNALTSPQLLC